MFLLVSCQRGEGRRDDTYWDFMGLTYSDEAQGQVEDGDNGKYQDVVVQLCRLFRLVDRRRIEHLLYNKFLISNLTMGSGIWLAPGMGGSE